MRLIKNNERNKVRKSSSKISGSRLRGPNAKGKRPKPIGLDLECGVSGSESDDDSTGSVGDLSCITQQSIEPDSPTFYRRVDLSTSHSGHGRSSPGIGTGGCDAESDGGSDLEPAERELSVSAEDPDDGGNPTAGGGARSRNWVFTINNWTEDDYRRLRVLGTASGTVYLCFQPEIAPQTGTPHLQGYWKTIQRTRKVVCKMLGGHCWVAPQRSKQDLKAAVYCCKPESRDQRDERFGFEEYGVKPELGQGNKLLCYLP